MTKKKAFQEIEQMFRSYRLWQLRLAAMQPRLVGVGGCAFIPRKGDPPRRPTENLAVQRADLAAQIERVQIVLKAMTPDETRFIEKHYFGGLPVKYVAAEMRWSRAQIYRMRISVLAKAAWILEWSNIAKEKVKWDQ